MTPPARAHDGLLPATVAGWTDGEALVRLILRGSDRVIAGVSGPGGSGKSTLLERMAAELHAAGARVVHGVDPSQPLPVDPDTAPLVVLVDDGEQLASQEVSLLDRVVDDDLAHLVVAFRPSPAAPVTEVLDHPGRRHAMVQLNPLSAADVARRADVLLGDAEPGLADRLLELTGGNPRLVDLTLLAVRDDGWDPDTAGEPPIQVLAQVAEELDGLDRDARDFVLALAVGFSTSGPALAMAPRFAGADTRALMQVARASGLVRADGRLAPLVRAAVLRTALPDETWSLRRELVDAAESAGVALDEVALTLADQGFRDRRVAAALEAAADELLPVDPAQAALRYAAAVDAGADPVTLEARRAQAAWGAGDIRTAERLVDRVLGRADSAEVRRGVAVAAAVWARQGLLRRSADAYERLSGDECGLLPLAEFSLAATGELERAKGLRSTGERIAYPTSAHLAADLMADGLMLLLDGEAERALSSLIHASSMLSDAPAVTPLPEIPAVLAAQVALLLGETGIADDLLASAIEAAEGGPAFTVRLHLMRGMVALRADRPMHARAHLAAARTAAAERPPGVRDELLAGALTVGLARHQGEIRGLLRAWAAARHAIAGMRPDLTDLPALAELVIAAARLDELHVVAPQLAEAWELLGRVGDPAPLTAALHWTEIEAGLLRDDDAAVRRHADALGARDGDRTAQRLAGTARVWAAALAGRVDVEEVERATRDLVAAGYPWDAARLAGHAAARAAEHQDSLRLLALARSLHPEESPPAAEAPSTDEDAPSPPDPPARDDGVLSAREREVARLVLEGRTYVEIGEAIFISPRTAEHHIARIRRRLGATNRSDLLAKLRSALGDEESR